MASLEKTEVDVLSVDELASLVGVAARLTGCPMPIAAGTNLDGTRAIAGRLGISRSSSIAGANRHHMVEAFARVDEPIPSADAWKLAVAIAIDLRDKCMHQLIQEPEFRQSLEPIAQLHSPVILD